MMGQHLASGWTRREALVRGGALGLAAALAGPSAAWGSPESALTYQRRSYLAELGATLELSGRSPLTKSTRDIVVGTVTDAYKSFSRLGQQSIDRGLDAIGHAFAPLADGQRVTLLRQVPFGALGEGPGRADPAIAVVALVDWLNGLAAPKLVPASPMEAFAC